MTPERKEKLRAFAQAGIHEHESAFMLELLDALDVAERELDELRGAMSVVKEHTRTTDMERDEAVQRAEAAERERDKAEQERDKARLAEDIQRQAANALAARVVPAEQRLDEARALLCRFTPCDGSCGLAPEGGTGCTELQAVLGEKRDKMPEPRFTFEAENQGRDPSQLAVEAGRIVLDIAPGLYRHYKGALYRVIGVVRDSTNGQGEGRTMVLYYSDAVHGLHVRELEQFTGTVALADGEIVPRFRRVGLAG